MARAASDDTFNAIADPMRRRLLERLGGSERSVAELTDGMGVTMAAISLHLKVLSRTGLVERRVAGRQRLYRLDPRPLRQVSDWAEQLASFWNDRLDRLQAMAEERDAAADRPED